MAWPPSPGRLFRRHRLACWVVLLLPFIVWPGLDRQVSAWFYQAPGGFLLQGQPLGRLVLKGLPPPLIGLALAALLLGGLAWARRRATVCGVSPRQGLFLALSLALGPGLAVNTLFKDHWHRARPSQIIEFGGSLTFSPVLQMADQCASNCSFSSGHGALGFWVVALAWLLPARRRPLGIAAACLFGAAVGLVRIAQGGHFLSDVVFSALLTVTLIDWLAVRLLERPVVPPPAADDR